MIQYKNMSILNHFSPLYKGARYTKLDVYLSLINQMTTHGKRNNFTAGRSRLKQ